MKAKLSKKAIDVLLIEDNPGDILLTRLALEESNYPVNLSVVEDGVEALAFLRKEGKYAKVSHPNLVFLDLNLPKKSGYEVLAELQKDESINWIPVIVLTTSQAEEDIMLAYKLAANSYITKPSDFANFQTIIQTLENFWFAVVKLPKA